MRSESQKYNGGKEGAVRAVQTHSLPCPGTLLLRFLGRIEAEGDVDGGGDEEEAQQGCLHHHRPHGTLTYPESRT